jgi:hypothetical protein
MKLLTLAKKLDFTIEIEYFDYCINSYFNGNFSQCEELFKDMSKQDKKGLLNYIKTSYNCQENYINVLEVYSFYFNLI